MTVDEAFRIECRQRQAAHIGDKGDCFYLSLDKGEYLLLCSDGLSNMVTRPEMLYEITHGGQERDCCRRMIDIAKKRGAPDNVTAVLIKY